MNRFKINPFKSFFKEGDFLMIHAYKYNGWLYRTWEYPVVLEVNDEFCVLSLLKSRVISAEQNSIRCFSSWIGKPTFLFISNKKWFNFLVTINEDLTKKIYINVSSPFIYEEGAIKYYDFDLDFKINPKNKWSEIDLNEFSQNSQTYNYPQDLIEIIKDVEADLIKKIDHFYFDQFIDDDYLNYLLLKQKKYLR